MSLMNSNMSATDENDSLKLTGSLDIYSAESLRDVLLKHAESSRSISIDLSAVEVCDVTGLQLLYSARRSAEAANKSFLITSVSDAFLAACAAAGVAQSDFSISDGDL